MAVDSEAALEARLQSWADGKTTLKDVRGYSDEELFSIARTGYFFYYQGKIAEARVVFQGLYAINPLEPYFAKALGVVEMASGNATGALAAYDVAIKINSEDSMAYVGRAEVRLSQGQRGAAVDDLRRAAQCVGDDDALQGKVLAMLEIFSKK